MQEVLDNMPKESLQSEIERLKPEMEKRLKTFPNVPGVLEAMEYSDKLTKAIVDQKEAK